MSSSNDSCLFLNLKYLANACKRDIAASAYTLIMKLYIFIAVLNLKQNFIVTLFHFLDVLIIMTIKNVRHSKFCIQWTTCLIDLKILPCCCGSLKQFSAICRWEIAPLVCSVETQSWKFLTTACMLIEKLKNTMFWFPLGMMLSG